jgi:hypothetical protein
LRLIFVIINRVNHLVPNVEDKSRLNGEKLSAFVVCYESLDQRSVGPS